jgi:hypothetical protein
VSVAGEWRRFNLGQGISPVADVFSDFQHSQAGEVSSIPIARSNSTLLYNQHRRLVIGGLCSFFRLNGCAVEAKPQGSHPQDW